MCLGLGGDNIHPDYLLGRLTWQQFEDWNRYYEQEPWGDIRADLRASANTLFAPGSDHNLIWPYFPDEEEMWAKHEALEARRKTLADDPEHQAKLKAARQKYWAEKRKANGG